MDPEKDITLPKYEMLQINVIYHRFDHSFSYFAVTF